MSELATPGQLAATAKEALRLRDQMREQGVPEPEIATWFERVVRQMWPFQREWKYLCETCRDYGLEMNTCPGDATCGRVKTHAAHDYGVPCWCEAGRRYKPKEQRLEDFTAAGKTPARKLTKWGR